MSDETTWLLPADVKQKWLAALRNGDWFQTREALRGGTTGNETYCCLGVLIETQTPGKLDGYYNEYWPDEEILGNEEWCDKHPAITRALAQGVWDGWDWGPVAGRMAVIHERARTILKGKRPWTVQAALVAMNDDGNCSFAQIADVIERNL